MPLYSAYSTQSTVSPLQRLPGYRALSFPQRLEQSSYPPCTLMVFPECALFPQLNVIFLSSSSGQRAATGFARRRFWTKLNCLVNVVITAQPQAGLTHLSSLCVSTPSIPISSPQMLLELQSPENTPVRLGLVLCSTDECSTSSPYLHPRVKHRTFHMLEAQQICFK